MLSNKLRFIFTTLYLYDHDGKDEICFWIVEITIFGFLLFTEINFSSLLFVMCNFS